MRSVYVDLERPGDKQDRLTKWVCGDGWSLYVDLERPGEKTRPGNKMAM